MTKHVREAFTCDTAYNTSTGTNPTKSSSSVDSNAIVSNISISLTSQEKELFETLENAAIAYENHMLPPLHKLLEDSNNNSSNDQDNNDTSSSSNHHDICIQMPDIPPQRIEIRIAGGWVRDKILNQSSHDVDVALDTLSGLQFASIVQRYLIHQEKKKNEMNVISNNHNNQCMKDVDHVDVDVDENGDGKTSKKKKKSKTPKIAVIAANPNQSKHLETATMTINSIDVDFVHLRGGEVYASDSRIPTLKENATPLDDALRRDFTVNSLFYNLRKKHVEDYTGRGIPDLLVNKALVTPIDANLTFHDDPLRVLRAIRFGVRYGLTLSEEIVDAARSKEVHDSLHVKVSRERVGKELEGMLSGKNAKPVLALKLMTDLKLAGCVFSFPLEGTYVEGMIQDGVEYSQLENNHEAAAHARELGWEEAAEHLKYVSPLLEAFKDYLVQNNDPENIFSETVDIRLFYLSVFLYPFHNLEYLDKKKKKFTMIHYMIKESIKFSNKDVSSMTVISENVDEMKSILGGYYDQKDSSPSSAFCRLRIGMVLRQLKDLWVTALLVAAVSEIRTNNIDNMDEEHINIKCKTIHVVMALYQGIIDNNLDGCWKMRPLLDGKEIAKSLDLPRGPAVGTYIEEQVRWMLVNPNGSRGECEEHLRSLRKRELEASSSEGDAKNETSLKHFSKKHHK